MSREISLFTAIAAALLGIFAATSTSALQLLPASNLVETGKIPVGDRQTPYRIRNLPVSSFPELPQSTAAALVARGCVIPQTYEAKRPENVIHASLERPGSSDWAVLCSVHGEVSLLVFFASASPEQPFVLAQSAATDRLQSHDPSGELGFSWGIDPASPQRVHEAQSSMTHRPPPPDHDCVADSIIDHRTVYHLYRNGAWETVEVE
jgi:hypothetical protein